MNNKVQYIIDSFIDFEGKEHKFVIAAVSTILPTKCKNSNFPFDKELENNDLFYDVDIYVEDYGMCDTYATVVKEVSLGYSICNPEDDFNEEIGKLKAYHRALCSKDKLFVTKAGMINSPMVEGLLKQEAEYLKSNPGSRIKGYKEKELKYNEQNKLRKELETLNDEQLVIMDFLKNRADSNFFRVFNLLFKCKK